MGGESPVLWEPADCVGYWADTGRMWALYSPYEPERVI